MTKKMVDNLRNNLGITEARSFSEVEEAIAQRRYDYENASEIIRAQMFGELSISYETLKYKVSEMLSQVPSLVQVVHNVEVLSDRLSVTTMSFFKDVFIDFDSSASNSISKLVANAIVYVKGQELAIYREGSSEYVKNIVMKRIEEQGEKGKAYSKSKFIRNLKRNPDKLKQFETVLTHYIEFQWKTEMMSEGLFCNALLDEAKQPEEGELTLNSDVLKSVGINA